MHLFTSGLWLTLPVAIALTLIGAAGCQQRGGRYLSLDQTLAESSLKTFLDTWKSGQTLQALDQLEPKIVGVDDTWKAGGRLTDYRVVQSRSDGANLHVTVELNVVRGKGPQQMHTVYIVGTSPLITIFPQ